MSSFEETEQTQAQMMFDLQARAALEAFRDAALPIDERVEHLANYIVSSQDMSGHVGGPETKRVFVEGMIAAGADPEAAPAMAEKVITRPIRIYLADRVARGVGMEVEFVTGYERPESSAHVERAKYRPRVFDPASRSHHRPRRSTKL